MPSEAAASTHHAPMTTCAISAATTTSESQPHVMLSMASARSARLPLRQTKLTPRQEVPRVVFRGVRADLLGFLVLVERAGDYIEAVEIWWRALASSLTVRPSLVGASGMGARPAAA
jgi:hypothetical protein